MLADILNIAGLFVLSLYFLWSIWVTFVLRDQRERIALLEYQRCNDRRERDNDLIHVFDVIREVRLEIKTLKESSPYARS